LRAAVDYRGCIEVDGGSPAERAAAAFVPELIHKLLSHKSSAVLPNGWAPLNGYRPAHLPSSAIHENRDDYKAMLD